VVRSSEQMVVTPMRSILWRRASATPRVAPAFCVVDVADSARHAALLRYAICRRRSGRLARTL